MQLISERISYHRNRVNAGMVNRTGFEYLPAAKIAIFGEFTRKCAIQKVR
jgi:hypothetical protein